MVDDIQKELENGERIGKLETEVHNLTTTVSKLFTKFDEYVEKTTPKAMSPMMILGGAVSLITVFGGLFASIIYISHSANAPVVAQLNQVITTVNTINNNTNQNANEIQLIKQSLSSIKDNKKSIEWILRVENLPKQINTNNKDIEYLKIQMNQIMDTYDGTK